MTRRVTITAQGPHARIVSCVELGMVVYVTTETSARTVRRLMRELLSERATSATLRKLLRNKCRTLEFAEC